MKATTTVTNDSSIILAKNEVRNAADGIVRVPFFPITSYLGPFRAMTKKAPLKSVENSESTIIVIASQLFIPRLKCLALLHTCPDAKSPYGSCMDAAADFRSRVLSEDWDIDGALIEFKEE